MTGFVVGGSRNSQNQDRKEAKVWLNIGYYSDEVDDNGEPIFVSLPYGLAIDTMNELKVTGNKEWRDLASAKNNLLEQLTEFGLALAEGETQDINTLVIQLRRANDVEETPTKENRLVKDIFKI